MLSFTSIVCGDVRSITNEITLIQINFNKLGYCLGCYYYVFIAIFSKYDYYIKVTNLVHWLANISSAVTALLLLILVLGLAGCNYQKYLVSQLVFGIKLPKSDLYVWKCQVPLSFPNIFGVKLKPVWFCQIIIIVIMLLNVVVVIVLIIP